MTSLTERGVARALPIPQPEPVIRRRNARWLWVGVWVLVVVGLQPWSSGESADGSTSVSANLGKGLLLGALLVFSFVSVWPGFKSRLNAALAWFLAYAGLALASSLLVSAVTAPVLRVVRIVAGLLLLVVVWRPLVSVPGRLVHAHLVAHVLLAATILAGLLVAPHQAWRTVATLGTGHRLQGVLLPMASPRVGEIGAIVAGLAFTLWLFKRLSRIPAVVLILAGLGLLAASRTRTAAAALLVGIVLALLVSRRSWRGRLAVVLVPLVVVAAFLVVPGLHDWLLRGQSTSQLTSLSGRTAQWRDILTSPLKTQTILFGHGLGNRKVLLLTGEGTVGVKPIDNSWLDLFWEMGVAGVVVVLGAFLATAWMVLRAPRCVDRTAAAFLLGYVALASLNETGLSDLSSLTVHLLVAAAIADAARSRARRARYVPGARPVRRPPDSRAHARSLGSAEVSAPR